MLKCIEVIQLVKMKNIKEKVLRCCSAYKNRKQALSKAVDITLVEVGKDLSDKIKKLEKKRKAFSDLNDEETKDLVRILENYKVPKFIETLRQERNCANKAMFIFGKLQTLKELKTKLGLK